MCALFEVPSQVINNIFSLNLFTEEGSVSFQDKQSNRWGGVVLFNDSAINSAIKEW